MNFAGTLRINKFACFVLIFILFLLIYWRSGGGAVPTENDAVDLKSLLKAAIQAAERGGKKVLEGKDLALNVKSKGKTLEGANDPVTDADYASHCAMFYSLRKTFSKVNIVSEEHSKGDSSCSEQPSIDVERVLPGNTAIEMLYEELVYAKDVTIWIDPLDATQEYTEGLYKYVTTMVCVAIRGVPIIGVIHFPFTSETYWGWHTKATSSNIPAVQNNEENKKHPRIIVSRSHPGKVSEYVKEVFGDFSLISAGGAGYKVMEVVNGTADVYLHVTAIKKWDLCAGNAILRALDGDMTMSDGSNIDYSPGSDNKVTKGIVASRFDHAHYVSKMPQIMAGVKASH